MAAMSLPCLVDPICILRFALRNTLSETSTNRRTNKQVNYFYRPVHATWALVLSCGSSDRIFRSFFLCRVLRWRAGDLGYAFRVKPGGRQWLAGQLAFDGGHP